MSRLLFIITGVCLGIALLLWVILQTVFGGGPIAWLVGEDLSHLERSQVGRLVDVENADHIVFRDGRKGWFFAPSPRDIAQEKIGFFGPRFFENLFSSSHQPMYCSSETSKILWVIRDDRVADALAFCKSDRMDLASLRMLAQPGDMEAAELSRAEVEALVPDVDADANSFWVTRPQNMSNFTHQQVIVLPYVWSNTAKQTPDIAALTKTLSQIVLSESGASPAQVSLQLSLQVVPVVTWDTNNSERELPPSHAIAQDNTVLRLDETVRILRPRLTIQCEQGLCAKMGAIDLTAPLLAYRDPKLLTGTHLPKSSVPNETLDLITSMNELTATDQKPSALSPITYLTRYIRTN